MIFVVGVDHCLQEPESTSGFWQGIEQTPRARRQREGFRALIQQIVSAHGCEFIGEEANEGQVTPAVREADRLRRSGRDIAYHNIEMTRTERRAAGIPTEGYDGDPKYDAKLVSTWNRFREQHMIREIQAHRGDSENLLIICGVRHMNPLVEYFRQQGEDVALPKDATREEWFAGRLSTE